MQVIFIIIVIIVIITPWSAWQESSSWSFSLVKMLKKIAQPFVSESVVAAVEQMVNEAGRDDRGSSLSSAYVWSSFSLFLSFLSSTLRLDGRNSWLTTLANDPDFCCCAFELGGNSRIRQRKSKNWFMSLFKQASESGRYLGKSLHVGTTVGKLSHCVSWEIPRNVITFRFDNF